jgi:membrane protein EpsK
MGALNLFLAVKLSSVGNLGFYGVAMAGGIVLSLKNAIFTPWYAAKIQGISPRGYFAAILPGFLFSTVLVASAFILDKIFDLSSWVSLIGIGLCLVSISAILVWVLALNQSERSLLRSLFHRRGEPA